MTVAIVLLAYAAGAGTLGSRLLHQARWTYRAPLLAIVTYLAAAWSVVAAAGLAGLALAVHATALGSGLSQLIGACVIRLRDTYATPGGTLAAFLGLALAAAVTARTAIAVATHLRAVRRHARRHAQAVRLVGRPDPALDAMLVEHPQPAAYCVAGPDPAVIVTTAALQALDRDQLAAVLAHERAHLAWHHHRLVALARIARQLLPFLPLMREAAGQVARLVEMHADDTATAAHDTRTLATALVVLAERGGLAPAPAVTGLVTLGLGATGPDAAGFGMAGLSTAGLSATGPGATGMTAAGAEAMQRIQRMIRPAEPLGRVRRQLLRAGAAGLALTPLLLALTPAVVALALGRVPVA
jgi:Zn-dependent protease with chaperone function